MSITPYPIQCRRDNKWSLAQTDELLPGDIVSVGVSSVYRLISFMAQTVTLQFVHSRRHLSQRIYYCFEAPAL